MKFTGHPSGWLEFRRRFRAGVPTATRLYDRRLWSGSRLPLPADRWRGCWSCSTPATGPHGETAGGRSRLQAQLQAAAKPMQREPPLGAGRPCASCALLRRDAAFGHDPGRWCRHHGRCSRPLPRRRGHHVNAFERIRAKEPVAARSVPTVPALHYGISLHEAGGKVDKDTPTQVASSALASSASS